MSENQSQPAVTSETQQAPQPIKGELVELPSRPLNAKLKAALAKAQMEIFNPTKNREVQIQGREGRGNFGYEYAELCTVTEIIRQPLAKNGLTYTQTTERTKDGWLVLTTLMHDSGEEKDFFYPLMSLAHLTPEKAFAGGFTYAKRQALKGIFGIADDTEDKDATENDPKATVTPKGKPAASSQKAPPASTPPPEEKPKEEAASRKNDPAAFTIPEGIGTGACTGKRLDKIPEKTQRGILNWIATEKAKVPPPSNLGTIIDVERAILAFFKSAGVTP